MSVSMSRLGAAGEAEAGFLGHRPVLRKQQRHARRAWARDTVGAGASIEMSRSLGAGPGKGRALGTLIPCGHERG